MPSFFANNLTDAQACAIRSLIPADTETFSLVVDGSDAVRAEFSVSASSGRTERDGFAVYPNSLLFRSGDYPDKKFSLAPDELKRAAKEWKPICGNIAHTDMLKGRAAFIDKVWAEDADGGAAVLRGEVRVPLALDKMLTDGEKRISMEWNLAGKFADGFALVTNPRISDAALMSLATTQTPTEPRMTFFDKLTTFFTDNGIKLPGVEANTIIATSTPNVSGTFAGGSVADPEKDALRRRVIEQDAALFAESEITAGRALPAERADLVAAFTQAALDDAALPTKVTFSAGTETLHSPGTATVVKTGSRVDALKATCARRPKTDLTTEQIASGEASGVQVVFSDAGANAAPVINTREIFAMFECRSK